MGLVLVVGDDSVAWRTTRHILEQAGYAVEVHAHGSALSEAESRCPAMFLIFADLDGRSGLELCRRARQYPQLEGTPILILLSSDSEEERLLALECGADDCVQASCGPRELIARVHAVMRRRPRMHSIEATEDTAIVIDTAAMKVSVRGNEIPTTTLEFRLVNYLAQHRGHVFTRDVLLDAVWGETQFVTPRSVDACIRRLRNKIEPDCASPTFLKTVRGVGYRFDAVAAWPRANDICSCSACAGSSKRLRLTHGVPRKSRALQAVVAKTGS